MSATNTIFRFFFTICLVISPLFNQGQSTRIPQIDSTYPGSTFSNSFLSSNRLQFTQGLTFTTSSGGGLTTSAGIYSNYMTYRVSDQIQINTGFNLVTPLNNGIYGQQKPTVDFDVELNYTPSENFNFKLGFSKINSENLYLYHRMGSF